MATAIVYQDTFEQCMQDKTMGVKEWSISFTDEGPYLDVLFCSFENKYKQRSFRLHSDIWDIYQQVNSRMMDGY